MAEDGARPEPEGSPPRTAAARPRYEVQELRGDHAAAVLAFERENRSYFAASVTDRGDDYFAEYAERHAKLLEQQAAGHGAFHVLVGVDGEILGRINLYDIADGSADVGYRMAERVAGAGVATTALRQLCVIAADRHGLRLLRAKTSDLNVAPSRVLMNAGFAPVERTEVAGRPGTSYERRLTPHPPPPDR
ncbi:GNAT family N-acetyltransferase [Aquihabitans sp. G128]|uniref:GNAT family N-acetyltransferase n=1 Tax=Aquihabitans sp. G128 TaxID=2849779 RepID=UPI001C22D8B7|nr:GNAT family N-acetyltransferase [Aquihabitans sp. G128]QXC63019.1 GNAT family N-acetyltransferase [Aquihabitans sp. G128]